MSATAIERRGDNSVFIFDHGSQYPREADGLWTKRTDNDGWRAVSVDRARRHDRAYQHRDELKLVQRFSRELVQRFPRLKPAAEAAEAAAKREQIRGLWAENQKVQAVNKQNRYELGKALDELHALRAHHGNGTYDKDVETLGIPKPTAWRIRNYYRDVAGLVPVSEFVSDETNLPNGPPAAQGDAAAILRARAAKQLKITQVRLDPERHKIFHKKLEKLEVALGTEGVSETTFKAIIKYEMPACAK